MARDITIVEGDGAVGELLALLVALTGDHDDVPLPRQRERALDRSRTVGLAVQLGPLQDLSDDCVWILAARVVRGHDRDVGELTGDSAHQRTFRPITIAPAAEDADHTAAGELARSLEHVLERLRLVRVVDDDGERLPLVDRFEPARNAREALDPGSNRVVLDLQEPAKRHSREHVLDVEAPAKPRTKLESAGAQARTSRVELELVGTKVGIVGEAERE